jgi:hypothetical protein
MERDGACNLRRFPPPCKEVENDRRRGAGEKTGKICHEGTKRRRDEETKKKRKAPQGRRRSTIFLCAPLGAQTFFFVPSWRN